MPLYTYECPECGYKEEMLLSVEELETANFPCVKSGCGKKMRKIMDAPNIGKPGFQMQAILESGERVSGHFGKSAKKKSS
jgi:putative FmdB family regulatory protein